MCVSQNWQGAFPRFFPSNRTRVGKTFQTYNGINVQIMHDGPRRTILVRSTNPLADEMIDYLRKCANGAFRHYVR